MKLDSRILEGRFVRLEPIGPANREAVEAALASDPEGWAIMATNGGPGGFDGWWAAADVRVGKGEPVFAVRRLSDGQVVGGTGYLELRPEHRGVEIGATFYRPDARGGPVNPDCKLLLLEHAFAAGALRVEFITDALNHRSRAAITKLGAVEEGVLRRHKITWTGRIRGTAVFSITDEEWPGVRAGLEARLSAF
ncbi:MAG: GNAT family N-acetyltransferase [Proteobacteria bacterium]|nr:GNAT family N-acetyltransferase [Pseudomonadota bacterium]